MGKDGHALNLLCSNGNLHRWQKEAIKKTLVPAGNLGELHWGNAFMLSYAGENLTSGTSYNWFLGDVIFM